MRRHSAAIGFVLVVGFACAPFGRAQAAQASDPRSHLSELIAVLQREWLHRDQMDWNDFRERVFEKAGTAETIADTYEAIRLALTLLGDRHTWYRTSSGQYIYSPQSPTQSTGECEPAPFSPPSIPDDVGYLRVQITPQTPPAVIQEALRKRDGRATTGWIVDLRNSRGGNTWPALVGLGSLLGDGVAGFFIDGSNHATPWGYNSGRAWLGEPDRDIASIETPYKMAPNSRVAVLTDIGVASSGEAIAIAFRGRPNTRSFGTPTCGLSTAIQMFPLKTGGGIGVMTSVMADRSMRSYGARIEPDALVSNPAEVVGQAISWLRQ